MTLKQKLVITILFLAPLVIFAIYPYISHGMCIGDSNLDGSVSISELIKIQKELIANSLNGCAVPTEVFSPTPSRRPTPMDIVSYVEGVF